jgi:ketosteroid isomerase-like protein
MRVLVAFAGVVALALSFAAAPATAQEWSPAQKEVWKNVETYWALGSAEKLDEWLEYFNDDYLGWGYESALPLGKESVRKWQSHFLETTESLVYEIQPVGILIHGDFAIVHYYYSSHYVGETGEHKDSQGRWTDILMKQGDRWVLIGDHGGETKGE